MKLYLTTEQQKLQCEISEFLLANVSEGAVEEWESGLGLGPLTRQLLLKVGEHGWLAPMWPRQYGGLECSHMEKFIITEELIYHGFPHPLIGAGMAGPAILMFGTDQQKQQYLPGIAKGKIEFALGYTEPEAGSDLIGMEMSAVDKGDHFVINGQKIFNTSCHYSDYHWLGVRTDREVVPRHKGISLFIVDMKSPGITIEPIWTMSGSRINAVYYDDVKVPRENLVGEKNRGWYQIAVALDFERSRVIGGTRRMFEHVLKYARESQTGRAYISANPAVRLKIAELAIEIEIAYLMAMQVAWLRSKGESPTSEASMVKLFGSELDQRIARVGMDVLGLYGQLEVGSKWAKLGGIIERFYLETVRYTITAGTSEIQRNIIALRGLGLPRE